jgi:thioredoxin reductase
MSRADVDVLVVGAGPAGLAAALELRRLGVARVLVVEREAAAGGIPRHAAHAGFGLRDLRRVLTGPAYSARYVRLAEEAGVDIRLATTATGWAGGTALATTAPSGLATLSAEAILLATGCRERPRSARLVPGDRPPGVMTTGTLQQLVYLHHVRPGRRAVVVGAEHVSFSAVLTLAHGGAATVALVTEHRRDQTYAPLRWLVTLGRVPILTASRVTGIFGRGRVEAVEVTSLATGAVARLACDTVVFTGDWIPDHELARRGDLVMDPATRAPRIDGALRTSRRGVFAAGNLVHAAETADVAALGGRHAARAVAAFLGSGAWPVPTPLAVTCAAPLTWVSPSALDAESGALPPVGFVLRVASFCGPAMLVLRQGTRVLWRRRYRRLVPNRSIHAAVRWGAPLAADGGPVAFTLES